MRTGRLRALTPTLFTDADGPRPDDALRAVAVALDAVVSRTSAALLWGIELAETPTSVTVTVPHGRTRVVADGVTVVRRRQAQDVDDRDGLRVTTVLETLLDLCRSSPLAHAVVAVDSALRQGLVRLEALQAAHAALPVAPGRGAVGRVLALVDPQSGSVLESLTRVLLAQHGVRPPHSQLEVRADSGRVIGRVDFGWPGVRLVVETDGFAFHSDRDAYRRDRRRTNALTVAGWTVLRFTWEDVVAYPQYVVDSVRAALARLAAA